MGEKTMCAKVGLLELAKQFARSQACKMMGEASQRFRLA
jgi:hypothetical protein